MFGKRFRVLKELPKGRIYMKIGYSIPNDFPEYFLAYEENGILEYKIIDDNFGMPSIANTSDSHYARNLRRLCNGYLKELIKLGYIELIDSN